MMKTRRKSKAAAAAVVESATRENSPAPPTTLSVNIPEDIDLDHLSSLLPDVNLSTPSPESLVLLYRVLLSHATDSESAQRELEEARADIQRKDVELDQALQDRETATSELESSAETLQKELAQVKEERDSLAAERARLQERLDAVSNTQTSSSAEVVTLKQRVEETEREKRDLMGVVSRLQEDAAQRDTEIQTLRADLKQARQDQQGLERKVRELSSSEASTKFKLDSLTQQLELARGEAERTAAELATKTEEFAKYRRTKHAELAQLQAAHDSLAQNHASTESTLKALQSAHTAQSHQLTQALTRVQDLKGQLAEQEATYSSEAAGLRRLIQMMEEREKQTKEIVDGLENDFAGIGDKAERREAVLREEIENQRQRAEDAEKRVEELQAVLDRLDRGEFPIPSFASPGGPATPARGLSTPVRNGGTPSDILTQGMLGLSPTVAMASRAQRGGKSFTEVYSDYIKLQEDFTRKCAEYDHMDRTLSAVLAQIEERAPILSQQRSEYERLQSEASQLASQLAQALSERDSLATTAEENAQKLSKSTRENELLEKQLQDLGRQLRTLLKELGRHQDPSIPSDEELEHDQATRPAENIEAVITNNLVLFRSIPQLQEQNQKLLKIVRELGSKLESEEKEYKDALEREQGEAVREAHEAIKQLQEQLESHKRSSEVTIQSYAKERDTLRSLLSRQQQSGGAVARITNGQVNGALQLQSAEGSSDASKELEEMQKQFETYRTEMGIDSTRLRDEALAAQREATRLGTALAKANAQIEVLTERQRMVQEQIIIQRRESEDLQKRNQHLYDQYTRIDIECNRMSEDLIASNSVLEQFRNECANLRAEKKIWESVQGRLVEENKTLATERSHLADLMANVQRMHNDLERSGENDRRRMDSQIKLLDDQNQDLRTQLTQERESVRRITLQRELDLKELQNKLDKASQDLSKTRESLIAAETSKKHLEDRVEQFTRQLQGNEEKLAVYERRASGVNGIAPRTDDDLSREQQLEAEVAELRSALKVAEVDLSSARSHVQQFREISEANEAALANLNATHDEYRAATEAELTRRQSEVEALQEKLGAAEERLAQVTQANTELQQKFDTERLAWADDKRTLEDTIVDISTSAQHIQTDRSTWEVEIHQQEERAKAAEERYSREVLSHAESIKSVEDLKKQLSTSQAAAREGRAAAETAQAKLATSEASWQQQREALDKEIADLKARCKDLSDQNGLLHQHLETVSTHAARIKQAATSSTDDSGEPEASDDADTKLTELRSLVTYLRKEKEIIELQLELSKQENTRLKTQIDHLSQNLDESRRALSEERERAVQSAASDAQHSQLAEKINQVSILRESNATLRSDCDSYAKRARQLEVELRQVSSELEPTKEQLRVAQAEIEAKEQQIKLLENESRRWQERNTQLLTKYDRIDPAEMQSLKDEITQLQAKNAELLATIESQKGEIAAHEQRIHVLEEAHVKLKTLNKENNQKAKTRFEREGAEIQRLNALTTELQARVESLTQELDEANAHSEEAAASGAPVDPELAKELEALRTEKANLEHLLAQEKAAHLVVSSQVGELQLRAERDRLLSEKAEGSAEAGEIPADVAAAQSQWEAEKAALVQAREDAAARAEVCPPPFPKANEEISNIRLAGEKYQERIAGLSKARMADNERAAQAQRAAVAEAVEKLRTELSASTSSAASADIIAKHAEELRALEERLVKKHEEELKAAVEAAVKTAGAAAVPADAQSAIDAAIAAHKKELEETHSKEIADAVERGRKEAAARSKLKDQQLVRAQAKVKELEAKILQIEGNAPGAAPATAPPTPTIAAPPAESSAAASTSTAPAPVSAPPAATAGPGKAGLPARPGGASAPRGRGRGVPPARGLSIRGAAPGGGRGAAVAAAGAAPNAGAANAAKRARDGDAPEDDAAAKRLKQGEGSKPPVQLRRDRVLPPS
ncbi:uncharacterized protein TRAVEDRAFT_121374 [Trametes versicolor FP-101664 SS1]|uniref:uncharacterized protein n=1 Tax=Trametes versicolor (strain FP-101664) TaxID=717944 RepID=UPI0004621851|nr:uncharacterized protein TRAVEDRAFT_121374 [Trametes versicolor FP-101664 SS1]EIW59409.1 hypothetical protein TRAVEDRAFT_121374 [Trametes versicolor FP-101664 SS1]